MSSKRKRTSKGRKLVQWLKRLKLSSDDPDPKPTVTDDNSYDSDEFYDAIDSYQDNSSAQFSSKFKYQTCMHDTPEVPLAVQADDTKYFECSEQPLPPAPSRTDNIFSRLPRFSSTTFDFRHPIGENKTMQSQAENSLHLTTDDGVNASRMKCLSQSSRPSVKELTDDFLLQVAEAIGDGPDFKVMILGQKLGFSKTDINGFTRQNRRDRKACQGTYSMLVEWRRRANPSRQAEELKGKCHEANLPFPPYPPKNSSSKSGDELKPSYSRSLPPGIDITVATSDYISTIAGLVDELWSMKSENPRLIRGIKTLQLPYSRLDNFTFTEHFDVLILCHSVEKRRFAITDVVDSLYDDFLKYCNKRFGKEKLVIIAHDFPPEREELRRIKMAIFQRRQPTTFALAGLVIICGQLRKSCELSTMDKDHLVRYLQAAANLPKTGHSQWQQVASTFKSRNFPSTATVPPKTLATSELPKITVYLCTSQEVERIEGLQSTLSGIRLGTRLRAVQHVQLPYSGLDSFEFVHRMGPSDVMVLCHSVQKRGFSVTDVQNALYDKYLRYCENVFGKQRMVVIVHDFYPYPIEHTDVQMSIFQPRSRQQVWFFSVDV